MIGDILRTIRVANENMSIKDAANKIGISAAYISEIEQGNKQFSLNTLKKFSSVYNVPLSKIMLWDEEQEDYQHTLIKILKYYLFEQDTKNTEQDINYTKNMGTAYQKKIQK